LDAVKFTVFSLSGILLVGLAVAPAAALDPDLSPSGNFDLTHWYLCLPVDVSGGFSGRPLNIKTAALSAEPDAQGKTG
jgi:hypothetical protein